MLRPGSFALTALLAALTAVGPLSTDMYLPSLPEIARLLGATAAETQLTISAFLVGFAIGQLVYGPLSDRHGRKPVLLGAMALYVVASIACASATSIEMLIAARAVQAFAGCGGIVLGRAVVRDLYSGARAGRELSLIASVMALAPVFAPVVGGLFQTMFGWRSVFLTLVLIGCFLAVIVWLLLPETYPARDDAPAPWGSTARSYGLVVRNRTFLVYTGLATTSYAGLFAWISVASFILQDLYGLPPFKFGVLFALGAVGYMSGATLATRIVVMVGITATVGFGCLAMLIGAFTMVAAVALHLDAALSLVIPMAVYLAGLGMVLPQSIAGAMTPFPERAGTASALMGFVQQVTAALCGVVVGQTLGHSAWPMVIAVAAMSCCSAALWVASRAMSGKMESAI